MRSRFRSAEGEVIMAFRNLLPLLAASLLVSTSAIAQNIPGKVINEPSRLDWETSGKDYTEHGVRSADIPNGGAAAHYTITRKGQNTYDITAKVPLIDGVTKGDDVTIGFWARTIMADTPDGNGTIGVRLQMTGAPYSGFADQSFSVGPAWKWYETTAPATLSLSKNDAAVMLQLAGARQTVEIGQVIVAKGTKSIASNTTTTTTTSAPSTDLPPPLKGKGQLINHPEDRNWSFTGPATAHVEQTDKTAFLGKSTRFTSPAAAEHPWDISTQVPIGDSIAPGDHIIIAIAARTISAATPDGKAKIGVRLQDNTPPDYTGYAETAIAPGPNWQLFQVGISLSDAIAADKGVVALHFAGAQQVVDIGPVYILRDKRIGQ
jgi:hypothetical protein